MQSRVSKIGYGILCKTVKKRFFEMEKEVRIIMFGKQN